MWIKCASKTILVNGKLQETVTPVSTVNCGVPLKDE
jgi:hypothetical protein